jgi:hypothetical protein
MKAGFIQRMKREKKDNDSKPKKEGPPVKPEKDIPVKPDKNPDPTKPQPGGNEPYKNDPTRIEEPQKNDPTRINEPEKSKKKKGADSRLI